MPNQFLEDTCSLSTTSLRPNCMDLMLSPVALCDQNPWTYPMQFSASGGALVRSTTLTLAVQ